MDKLISAEALMPGYEYKGSYDLRDAHDIKNAPEAVVRCKDCKHRDSDECPHGMMYHPDDMGYCAWGERREDETD